MSYNTNNSRNDKGCDRKGKRSNYNRRTKKSQTSKGSNDLDIEETGKYKNNPMWYFDDTTLADQVSSFSFDSFVGVNTDVHFPNGQYATDTTTRRLAVPGIMAINVNPSAGFVFNSTSGINIAALRMYTMLSSQNAKTTQYAPQDLAILMLALGNVISIMQHIRRAFGVAFTYNQRNRLLPQKLLEMMGFKSNDFLSNVADNRIRFNSLVVQLNRIPFMSNIAYFHKCDYIYSGIYTDSVSPMAQIMFMRPETAWTYDEEYNPKGGGLRTTALPSCENPGTFEDWYIIVADMLNALSTSSLFNYVYADVINYCDKKGAAKLMMAELVEGYTVPFEYNEHFLMQVHNATFMGKPSGEGANDVSCDANNNLVVYNPEWESNVLPSVPKEAILDLDTPTATVEQRIDYTRYITIWNYHYDDAAKKYYANAVAMPDHYVTRLCYYGNNNGTPNVVSIDKSMMVWTEDDAFEAKYFGITVFDWAPNLYMDVRVDGNPLYFIGDLNYYTTLDTKWVQRVADLAMIGLFTMR